jgi:hypothetical protein
MDSTLEAWWEAARQLVHKKDRRGFDALVMLTAWMLWKQRNARVFNNVRQQMQCAAAGCQDQGGVCLVEDGEERSWRTDAARVG